MRVICPRCGAEYEIDDQLIPANGREVECSSCDNVWFQPGRLRMPEPLARLPLTMRTDLKGSSAQTAPPDQAGQDKPPDDWSAQPAPTDLPHRRPSAEALRILRDEAARFRASRPGIVMPGDHEADDGTASPDRQDPSPDAAPAPHEPGPADQGPQGDPPPQWSDQEAASDEKDGSNAGSPSVVAGAPSAESPTRTTAIPAADMSESDAPPAVRPMHSFTADAHHDRRPVTPEQHQAAVGGPTPPRRRRFGTGFAIGILIAAILTGLYAAAPLAGDGWVGDMLQGLRGIGDDFHQWVQNHLTGPR